MTAKKTLEKMLSLMIVALFVLSPMAILLQNTEANQTENSIKAVTDLYITGTFVINENTIDPKTHQSGMYGQDGNITVANGGTLIIRNATLYFLSDNGNDNTDLFDDNHYWLKVDSGGTLIMENATLTVSDAAVNPYLKLPVTIEGRAILNNSVLAFPGSFTVDNGILYANYTTFKGLDSVATYDYNEDGAADTLDVDDNDDCPIMKFIDSKTVFADSKVENYYENTHLPQVITFYPSQKGAVDNTGEYIQNLSSSGVYYTVNPGEEMYIDEFNSPTTLPYGLSMYGPVISADLTISWAADPAYNGTNDVWLGLDGNPQPISTIHPDGTAGTQTIDLLSLGIDTIEEIRQMDVNFTHNGDNGTVPFDLLSIDVTPLYEFNITVDGGSFYAINTYFDLDFRDSQDVANQGKHDVFISKNGAEIRFYNVTVDENETSGHPDFVFLPQDSSKIYFYGWLNIHTIDGNSDDPTPVPYCRITPVYFAPSPDAINITKENNTLHNGDPVLEYLNRTFRDRMLNESNYNTTNASGIGEIPLLKDLITSSDLNGVFLGNYNVTAEEHIQNTSLSQQINFPPYPEIKAENNTFNANYAFSWSYPPRDLAISPSNISIEPAPIVRGDLVWVNATIHNIGGINVTEPFDVNLLVDGTVVNSTTVSQMVERNNGTVNVSIGWQTVYGDYGNHEITVAVDPTGNITDGNRSNNNATVNCFVNALYDLSIIPLHIWWENTTYGNYTYLNLTVYANVTNEGYGDISGDITVEFYVDGNLIGSDIINGISAHSYGLASTTYSTDTAGDYNISVNVKPPAGIEDDNMTNNTAYRILSTDPTPDLIIDSITFSPNPVIESFNTTINATVSNVGETYANGTITVDFYDNTTGEYIGQSSVSTNLSAGSSTYLQIVWKAKRPVNTLHTISANVTFTPSGTNPPETNTGNNGNTADITVNPYVDLSISDSDITVTPANPYTYQQVNVSATVHNSGNESVGGFTVEIYRGMPEVKNFAETTAAYGVASVYYDFGDVGARQVRVIYSGNWSGSILVDSVSWSVDGTGPKTFDVTGRTLSVTFQKQESNSDVLRVELVDVSGSLIASRYIDGMPAHGTTTVSGQLSINTSGDYVITVVVDTNNDVSEVFEANNSAAYTLHISPTPDLIIPHMSASEKVVEYENVTITATVENVGETYANGTITVDFYDNTTGIWIGNTSIVSNLSAGSSVDVSINWSAVSPEGNHTFYAVVSFINSTGDPPETNTANNRHDMSKSIYVKLSIDLAISDTDISYTPAAPLTYQNITVSATIHNIGRRNITDQFTVEFLINTAPYYVTVNGLNAGESTTVSIVFSKTISATYTVTVIVDSKEAISESNEHNNQATTTIYIGPRPEFSISSVTVLSQHIVDNHDVTLAAEISNTGTSSTGTVDVIFYDGNPDAGGTLIGTRSYTDPAAGWHVTATYTWHATGVGSHVIYVRVVASTSPPEGVTTDNTAYLPVEVLPRPDLTITNMTFLRNGEVINSTSECAGFDVNITIANIDGNLSDSGITSFTVSFFSGPYVEGNWSNLLGNITFDNQTQLDQLDNGVPLNLTLEIPRFTFSAGTANIYAIVDLGNVVDESSESNNQFNKTITIMEMVLNVQISSPINGQSINLQEQKTMVIIGHVRDSVSNEPVQGIVLHVGIRNVETGALTSQNAVSGKDGSFRSDTINLPANPGDYELVITAERPDGTSLTPHYPPVSLSLQKPAPASEFPFWMVLLIGAIIAVAVVAGALLVLRRYALGKYVECGQCGKMIPAGSDKCPYCGAVFDKETVKCSVCGAWIPADATECPKCGAKFLVTGKEIVDYETQMRQQYEEFVDKFRKQAKEEMGKDYSEEKFQQWWKSQKSYVTFEDWLKREEERKKTGGIICPVCGALNSKTDIVCHVCGSPLRPTKKKLETEGIEGAAISKIELPSLEEKTEGEKTGEEEAEKPEEKEGAEEGERSEEKEEAEKEEPEKPEEPKIPPTEEKPTIRPVKKVVKKVVKRPVGPPEQTGKEESAPAVPEHLIGEIKKSETAEKGTPEAPTGEKPPTKPVKKVVKKVVRKKVVKK